MAKFILTPDEIEKLVSELMSGRISVESNILFEAVAQGQLIKVRRELEDEYPGIKSWPCWAIFKDECEKGVTDEGPNLP